MRKTKENGITLVTLVITIIVLLMLTSIGTTAGISTINMAKFNQFKNELQMLQTKVNGLNQENKTDIGTELTTTQQNILDTEEVSNIIYKDRTDEEKTDVKNSFIYLTSKDIKEELGLEGIKRDYLISIKYRYVVSCQGVKYKDQTYYMIEQSENGLYNVEYKDKNSKTGTFDVNAEIDEDKWKITVSNIQYDGYVSNWQVKYKMVDDEYWKTSYNLEFYVEQSGSYIINVIHGDEIDLGKQTLDISPKYAETNLILNYDAINNISDAEHSSDTLIWKDLSKNKNDAQITGATWGNNYLSFDGVDDFAITTSNIDYNSSCAVTLQLVLVGGIENSVTQMILESSENWSLNPMGYGITFNEYGTKDLDTTVHHSGGYNIKATEDNIVDEYNINVFTFVINNYNQYDSFIKVYKNGEVLEIKKVNNFEYNLSNTKFENYKMYIASRAGNNYFSKMKLGALRVYNRELNKNEIKDSYELDSKRFK